MLKIFYIPDAWCNIEHNAVFLLLFLYNMLSLFLSLRVSIFVLSNSTWLREGGMCRNQRIISATVPSGNVTWLCVT